MESREDRTPLLRMEKVSKSFPGVRALDQVDFDVRAGEVHALLGENGAGKSTLIKVLTGVHRPDEGRVFFQGRAIAPSSPHDCEACGISTVYQEVPLIPRLSVAENVLLGRQPSRWGFLRWKELRRQAAEALRGVGLQIDLDRPLGDYSMAIQQMVTIARALSANAKVLVLDEPTSSLDEREVDDLLALMQQLKGQGLGLVFVTHFLDQVYKVADRITVLRDGRRVEVRPTEDLSRLDLIGKMLGRPPSTPNEAPPVLPGGSDPPGGGEPLLVARGLGRKRSVRPFSLRIAPGDRLGFAGLLGSGRTEAARLLFGLDRATEGELRYGDQVMKRPTPRKAIAAGFAFCPEDRKREGLLLDLTVRENIVLAMQAHRGVARTLPHAKQIDIANHYIRALRIKTPHAETRVGSLSGGNQQKVLLARWLAMSPKLFLLDEPTRGIDIGARAEIESLIGSLRDEGASVLLISSELEEVVSLCERVAVFRDRQVIGEASGDEVREDRIMDLIAQNHEA